jgi:hypothetical protein
MRKYSASVTYYTPKPGESSGGWSGSLLGLVRLIIKYADRADILVRAELAEVVEAQRSTHSKEVTTNRRDMK